ncbi:MAG: 16S rRNA (guanine(966)-N(2))-methyltransferase RsmD [Tenacibaculum sp.]
MRIISGKYKGKKLSVPKKLPVRPTTDMAKESLFNILRNIFCFDEISVIDLFAGTGNISYEFASRASKKVYAVDANFRCIRFIRKTSKELGLNLTVYKSDVYKFLENTTLTADLIFADPPYYFKTEVFLKIVDIVFERNLLNRNGLLIIEHSKHSSLNEHLMFKQEKKYGSSVFSFFKSL